MPYPILTLPLPFTQRLRQLLSPIELQNLQTAAGNDIRDLLPLMTTHTVGSLSAYCFEHVPEPTIIVQIPGEGQRPLSNAAHIVKCQFVATLWYMSESTVKNLKISMIKAPQVNFLQCNISNELLQQAAKVVETPVVNVVMFNPDVVSIEEDVNFLSLIEIFPKVNCILLNSINDPEKIIEKNHHKNDEYLYFAFRRFEEFYCFEPEELFDYISKKSADFCLYVDHKQLDRIDFSANYLNKVTPFIDSRFDRAENGDPKICIRIPGSDRHWMWYLKKE